MCLRPFECAQFESLKALRVMLLRLSGNDNARLILHIRTCWILSKRVWYLRKQSCEDWDCVKEPPEQLKLYRLQDEIYPTIPLIEAIAAQFDLGKTTNHARGFVYDLHVEQSE